MTTNLTNLVPVSIQYYSFIGIYIMLLTGSFLYTALLIHAIVSYLKHLFFSFISVVRHGGEEEKHYLISFLGNLDLGLSLSETS